MEMVFMQQYRPRRNKINGPNGADVAAGATGFMGQNVEWLDFATPGSAGRDAAALWQVAARHYCEAGGTTMCGG